MFKPMQGVRVLEVAQFTFVPAAGAILADWGADVIKIEHPVRGDTQRGFINMGGFQLDPDRHPLMEHPNRGKRSVGVDVSTPGGQEVLYEIARTADVFLTNYMPAQRQKNKFDVEHIRAANPNIIYARGSAYGDKGAERDTGGFDGTAFWTRSGIGHALTPERIDGALSQGIPAFGDSIGGMNIAGGISAALFHRERTGETCELDVSLLSTAWWAAGASVTQAPVYYDYQAMIQTNPTPDSSFRIAAFGSDDALKLLLDKPSPGEPALSGNVGLHTAFQRVQARYRNDLPNGDKVGGVLALARLAAERVGHAPGDASQQVGVVLEPLRQRLVGSRWSASGGARGRRGLVGHGRTIADRARGVKHDRHRSTPSLSSGSRAWSAHLNSWPGGVAAITARRWGSAWA